MIATQGDAPRMWAGHRLLLKRSRHVWHLKAYAKDRRAKLLTNEWPADQEKAIVYNELVANAVALQTVADQTDALHELRGRGVDIAAEDLSFFSPYPTSKVKRFGEYPPHIKTDSRPPTRHLPAGAPLSGMSSA